MLGYHHKWEETDDTIVLQTRLLSDKMVTALCGQFYSDNFQCLV